MRHDFVVCCFTLIYVEYIATYVAISRHVDVIKWKHFPRYWPFVRGIHRSPAQRPVTRSFDVFFDLHPNKRLSKQWWGWWFETPSSPLWRHCNGAVEVEVKWRSNVSAGRILFDTCDTVTLDELVFTSDHKSIVTTQITDNSIVYSSACTSKQQDLT